MAKKKKVFRTPGVIRPPTVQVTTRPFVEPYAQVAIGPEPHPIKKKTSKGLKIAAGVAGGVLAVGAAVGAAVAYDDYQYFTAAPRTRAKKRAEELARRGNPTTTVAEVDHILSDLAITPRHQERMWHDEENDIIDV